MLAFLRPRPFLASLPLLLASLTGCGMAYQPGRAANFELDSAKQIDDADIQKAFEARPQLPSQIRVAYYSFDPDVAKDLDVTLAAVPGVVSVYRIPPLMISGQRRFDGPWQQHGEVTVKKLRLFAARARADVLIVVDHGYKSGGANGLSALNLLVLPILFMPFLDNTVEGYAEAYLIDVRNGYLYGHVDESDKRGDGFATIYGKSARTVADEQWVTLRKALQKDISRVIADERPRAVKAAPAVNTATPAPPAPPTVTPPVAPDKR